MRTSVQLKKDDDATDEFPDCGATVDTQEGILTIVNSDMWVEYEYGKNQWYSVTVTNE